LLLFHNPKLLISLTGWSALTDRISAKKVHPYSAIAFAVASLLFALFARTNPSAGRQRPQNSFRTPFVKIAQVSHWMTDYIHGSLDLPKRQRTMSESGFTTKGKWQVEGARYSTG
jgi:hypothetical protein